MRAITKQKFKMAVPIGLLFFIDIDKYINALLALCFASDGVFSLTIRITMVALRSNSFCQTNAGTQDTDAQLLFYSILHAIIRIRCSII